MNIFVSKPFSYEAYRLLRLEHRYNIAGKFLYLFFNNKHNREIYKKEKEYYSSLEENNLQKAEKCVEEMEHLGLLHTPRIAGLNVTLKLEKIRKGNE